MLLKFLLMFAVNLLVLFLFQDVPQAAIFIIDIFICVYLISSFRSIYKLLFLLHPFVLIVSSILYTSPFLEAGDGGSYQEIVRSYMNTQELSFDFDGLIDGNSLLNFFKVTSLGVAPVYAVPEYFFKSPNDGVYYLWQGTFHVLLSSIIISLAIFWRILNSKYILGMALFAVLSPTSFDLGAAPTRHIVTLFGVFLLGISHVALMDKFSVSRMLWFSVAIATVLISKAPLMLSYIVYVAIDFYLIRRIKIDFKNIILILVVGIIGLLMSMYFIEVLLFYEEISSEGGTAFSGFVKYPIIGWFVKYVYALLSPFPWSQAPYFISTIYGGNWLLFLMHTLSSLIGLYLFLTVIIKWKCILASDVQFLEIISFALVMSLSILMGATGFHTYLSIYFVMLSPLLCNSRYSINPFLPFGFVVLLEAILLVV